MMFFCFVFGILGISIIGEARGVCDVTNHCFDCADSDFGILNSYVCDNEEDCPSGDDEDNCSGDYVCSSSGQLLHPPWRCDGVIDCTTADDEMDCGHCSNTAVFHECPLSKLCLHKSLYFCDGTQHCSDGSDEENCGETFQCSSGELIYDNWKCNGVLDCASWEDEMNCDHCTDTDTFLECSPDSLCLMRSRYVCDGYVHCDDGADEVDCGCDGKHHFACNDGTCILDDLRCDGEEECPDGEDEDGCRNACTASQFECLDYEKCISLSARCDGNDDCNDGSDEWYCVSLDTTTKAILVNHQGLNSVVCSSHWDDAWNDITCTEMGYGSALSHGTTALSTVSQYVDSGFVLPLGNDSASSLMDAFQHGESCDAAAVTLQCNHDACGSRSEAVMNNARRKIVNGDDALDGHWPWQITLEVDGEFTCGGSLISSQWVMTAAHCVDVTLAPEQYTVRLGSSLVYGQTEHLQEIAVMEVNVHEDYDDTTLTNDIALLKLSDTVEFSDYVRPVCLPTEDEEFSIDEYVECYTSGWGGLNHQADKYPINLQELKVSLVPDDTCVDNVPEGYNKETMMCAGYAEFATNCQGDSGGPLVCRSRSTNTWTQAGVVSWVTSIELYRISCSNYPVYAEVAHYQTWIESFGSGASFTALSDPDDTGTDGGSTSNGDDSNNDNGSSATTVSASILFFCLFLSLFK